MRASAFAIVFFLLFSLEFASAEDLVVLESTCLELGFKKKTPAFGECVLELDRRNNQQSNSSATNSSGSSNARLGGPTSGDGTPDDQTCQRYGYQPGYQGYAQCRMTIDIARQETQQRQAKYELDMRRYEEEQQQYQERLTAYEKEKERQRKDAALRMGLAMMGGTSRNASENIGNAARQSLGIPPVAPMSPQIQNFMITGPSGRMTNCSVVGQLINCN